jgi:hypothetical protein
MRSFLRLARVRRQGGSRPYTMRLCVSGIQEFFVSCVQVAVIRPRLADGWSTNKKLAIRSDDFRRARQPSMIALNRDQIGGLPTTQDLSPGGWA